MLHFLTSLFESRPNPDQVLQEEVIGAAIERAIDKTDQRLRALGAYRKRLHDPVERALRHVLGLVDQLPEPAEISPGRYAQDSRLRAMFASPEHLREVLGRFHNVREYLEQREGPPPDPIFGLLSVAKREKRTLGLDLEGDLLKRDVLQTVVTFEDHQFLAPSDTEASARTELTTRAFDFLLENARDTLTAEKLRRGELVRKRQLLRRKLLSPVSDPSGATDYGALEADMAMIDEQLGYFGGIELSLEESLQRVEALLNDAGQWLALTPYHVGLDYRNIKTASAEPIDMSGISSLGRICRIVLFGRIPRRPWPGPTPIPKFGSGGSEHFFSRAT